MRITLSKRRLYQFIFVLCVAVPYLDNYELTFTVWFFAVLFSLRKSYSKTIVYQIVFFSLILLIAFVSSFFNNHKLYDFIRDITYLLKPILGMLLGYQICKNHLTNPIKTVIYAGVFIASLHMVIVFWSFLFYHVRNIHILRYYAGYFSDFEVYALVVLIFNEKLGVEISPSKKKNFIILLAVSSMFYLSRTNFIQFLILVMALKGYFVWTKKTIVILSTFILSATLFYGAILFINPKRNGSGIEAFLYKVKISPTEPFKTKINTDDYKDYNDNYRSVESILTISQNRKEWNKIVFGKGLGSVVDLHRKVMLDDTELEFISILHNGFMTVYLKSGIIGVLVLILSILFLNKARFKNEETKYLNYLMTGTIIFLFFSYWVFMGFYFKADTKVIIVGLLIALIEKKSLIYKNSITE